MNSSSASTSVTWSQWGDDIFAQEKIVFKTNIPLVLSTSIITAVYSYFGIDGNTNSAVNRALLMALSTFLGASAVNVLENNNYLMPGTNSARYLEGAMIPMFYYFITKRQFGIPDVQSQTLKTGIISSIAGELANPMVTKYYDQYTGDKQATPTTKTPPPSTASTATSTVSSSSTKGSPLLVTTN